MTKSGVTVEFLYDHNGLRTQKKVTQNGVTTTTNYMLHGKLVTHMTVGSDKLHFFYDAQNRPAKVSFNGVIYTYIHNLQGDIIGLLDSNGALVVEYKYDAWGKLLSTIGTKATTLGKLNSFRYRGYVYDEESGLYHLQNRYYNPVMKRFINADTLLGMNLRIGEHNLYAYCQNRPVMFFDPSGNYAIGFDGSGGGGMYSMGGDVCVGAYVPLHKQADAMAKVDIAIGALIIGGLAIAGSVAAKSLITCVSLWLSGSANEKQGKSFAEGVAISAVSSFVGSTAGNIVNAIRHSAKLNSVFKGISLMANVGASKSTEYLMKNEQIGTKEFSNDLWGGIFVARGTSLVDTITNDIISGNTVAQGFTDNFALSMQFVYELCAALIDH